MFDSAQPHLHAVAHDAAAHLADRVGATASLLCAAHCAALPFVLTALPMLGLGFLADHEFERIFIACASVLALGSLLRGWRRHRNARALWLALAGLALLWIGAWLFDASATLGTHAILVTIGGCCVAMAHLLNLRFTRAGQACCPPAAH